MRQFLGGVAAGVLLSWSYVYWDWELPGVLNLPKMLRGNLVSTAVEDALYDLNADAGEQQRALKVLFENRADFAAQMDADAGHPFIAALRRHRAVREARQLLSVLAAHKEALNQPGLRAALERKHNTSETSLLLERMSSDSLDGQSFLKSWLESEGLPIEPSSLGATLTRVMPGYEPKR